MRRRWLGLAAAVWIVAGVVVGFSFARPGVVVTKDGKSLEGEVTEKNDQVVITIHGVESTLPRDNVASITYSEDFNKEFASRLAKLGPNDAAGRIALARWAFERRQYGKAREVLDAALGIDPNNREATDLLNTISVQMRLESTKGAAGNRPMPTPPPGPPGMDRRFLSANDINTMRQRELQPTDRVNIRLENNVEKRYLQFANLQFSQFNALTPVNKALAILEKGDDTMKADVKILGDPASIFEYRRTIQPVVLNGCAASNCHGGPKGGELMLFNPGDGEPASYTNLFILVRYAKKVNDENAGLFASRQRKMIDRGHGAHSILAQYALPADVSEFDHPKVQGYDGLMRNGDDVRFKQITDWMDRSLKQPEPDYSDIKFDPPKATSQPSTKPTR